MSGVTVVLQVVAADCLLSSRALLLLKVRRFSLSV